MYFNPSIDDLKSINISVLGKFNQLKPNTQNKGNYQWTSQGNLANEISYIITMYDEVGIFEISYIYNNDKKINYSISIISLESNLGKGRVYYFVCPKSKKLCRKLYLFEGYFLHRSCFKGLIYETQKQSKKIRKLNKLYLDLYDESKILDLIASGFRKYYRGKPTKKYIKYQNLMKNQLTDNSERANFIQSLLMK